MDMTGSIPDLGGGSFCSGKLTAALGCFDGLHLGHISVINAAKCDNGTRCVLSVGEPFRVGGRTTRVIPQEEEKRVLAEAGVDLLIAPPFAELRDMSGEDFIKLILFKKLGVSLVSCGSDFRFGKGARCDAPALKELAEDCGMECIICPQVDIDGRKVSSTWLRELLADGNIKQANRLLGRCYGYSVPVRTGMHLARRLGAPTINQPLPEDLFPMRRGVYASKTLLENGWHYSVTNIGVKPTVEGSDRRAPLSETWIPDFSGDLYGKTVRVELIDFIRDERSFDSLDELGEAIRRDGHTAMNIWNENMRIGPGTESGG